MSDPAWDLLVRRDNLREHRCQEREPTPLQPGQVAVRVDRFALTANNVTYGVFGDALGYWRFFPAPAGWGCIPAWGFGAVTASTHPDVPVGERLYGYLPMSTDVVLTVGRLTPATLTDAAEHRQALPPTYNQYARVAADPGHRPEWEDAQAVLRPLFTTGWLLDDQLADAGFHDAEAVLLTSASSKTAISLAHQLHARATRPRIVGLTSAANIGFVERLGLYDQVFAYDALDPIAAYRSAVLVDFAGRDDGLADVHRRLGDRLRLSLRVGATHWEAERGGADPEHGPEPVWFFAPDRIRARAAEWGRDAFDARLGEAWAAFVPSTAAWLKIQCLDGYQAASHALRALIDGTAGPAHGLVVRPALRGAQEKA